MKRSAETPQETRSKTARLGAPLGLAIALLAGCNRAQPAATGAGGATASATALPPPTRPDDALAELRFGQPHTTGRAVGRLVGLPLPVDLIVAAQAGLDQAVLTAADLTRPVTVLVVGTPESPHYVAALAPAAMNSLRSTLGARFRFTAAAGLGERLEPRGPEGAEPGSSGARARRRPSTPASCALVPVPGALPVRIVCADDAGALERAGRYTAHLAVEREGERAEDLVLRLDGAAARGTLATRLQRSLERAATDLGASAALARRAMDRAPDLGDPEVLVGLLRESAGELTSALRDVQGLTLRASVEPAGIVLTGELPLDPAGETAVANDARDRAAAPTAQPLAARLATDAPAVLAARGSAARTTRQLTTLAETLLRVLGERVPQAEAARDDVRALLAHTGDAVALSLAPEAATRAATPGAGANAAAGAGGEATPRSVELMALLAQADGGAGARAALARIARAPWLAGTNLGGGPLRVRFANNALTLTLPPSAPASANSGANSGASAGANSGANSGASAPRELGLAVVGDALVVTVSSSAARSLAGVAARAQAGVSPRALADAEAQGPVVLAIDTGALGDPSERGAEEDRPQRAVAVTYRAQREASGLTASVQVRVPADALATARRAIMSSMRRRRGAGGAGPAGLGPGTPGGPREPGGEEGSEPGGGLGPLLR